MFKFRRGRAETKGDATRRQVLEAALALFRKRGYERTTMRAIADQAGLSLGAAYHYFDSKDAILSTYYEWTQDEHERALAAVPSDASLRERIAAAFETKLAIVQKDRRLLGALFGRLGDPTDPLSVFGKKSATLRARSLRAFTSIVADSAPSPDVAKLAGRLLWLSHLGVLLYFVHDRSPRQAKTRELVSVSVDLAAGLLPLLAYPQAGPVLGRLLSVSADLDPSKEARS